MATVLYFVRHSEPVVTLERATGVGPRAWLRGAAVAILGTGVTYYLVTPQVLAKLNAAASSLAKAEDHIDRSKLKQANNMLPTASRQLGAFINAVEAGENGNGNRKLPESRRVAFVEAASDTIVQLSAAQNAAI